LQFDCCGAEGSVVDYTVNCIAGPVEPCDAKNILEVTHTF